MFLSPTLTASSSSTAVHSQLTPDLPDLAMDKGVDDFSEMFNFDDFENEGASVGIIVLAFYHLLTAISPMR